MRVDSAYPFRDIDLPTLTDQLRESHAIGHTAEERLVPERTFGGPWVSFLDWCQRHGFAEKALPVSKDALAGWLLFAAEDLPESAIVATLAAIRKRHVAAGLLPHLEELGA